MGHIREATELIMKKVTKGNIDNFLNNGSY